MIHRSTDRTRASLASLARLAPLALLAGLGGCALFPFLAASAGGDRPGPVEGSRAFEIVDITGGTVPSNLMLNVVLPVRFVITANGQETDNGTMQMLSPCNTVSYRYFVESKARLRMVSQGATEVACEPALAAIEAAVTDILPDLVSWSGPDTALVLRTSDGRRLHLAPGAARYHLLSADGIAVPLAYLNNAGTVSQVMSDTLVLRGDGLALFKTRTLVSGPGGANLLTTILTADYQRVGADSIRFTTATVCLAAPCPTFVVTGFHSTAEVRMKRFPEGAPASYRYQVIMPFGM